MVDVFEQVEEELRSDRYKRLARTWLPVAAVVVIVALIGALGWWGWDSYQSNRAAKGAEAYDRGLEALRESKPADARAAFQEAVEQGNGAYKALALQQQAAQALDANKVPDAVRLFDESAKATRDPILSDTASLKAAWLLMDTAPLAELERRLTPLAEDDRPLHAFAQHALALARLQHGKAADARSALVVLQLGQDVPDAIRQQAQAAIAMIDSGTVAALPKIVDAAKAAPPPAAPQVAPASQAASPASPPAPAAAPTQQ